MPLFALHPALHRFLGDHLVHGEVLADVAQELHRGHRVSHSARFRRSRARSPLTLKSRKRSAATRTPSDVRIDTSSSVSRVRSAVLPLGSPIKPVPPPTSAIGLWPEALRTGEPQIWKQDGRYEGSTRWHRSRVQRDRLGREQISQRLRSSRTPGRATAVPRRDRSLSPLS